MAAAGRRAGRRGPVAAVLDSLHGHSSRAEGRAVQELLALGPAAVPDLVWEAAHHSNAFARSTAVRALGAHPRRYRPAVVRAMRDAAVAVRLAALLVLDETWSRSAPPLVIRLLRDPSGGIRVNAAAILGRHRVRAAVSALTRALDDDKPYVRREAARSLERIGRR